MKCCILLCVVRNILFQFCIHTSHDLNLIKRSLVYQMLIRETKIAMYTSVLDSFVIHCLTHLNHVASKKTKLATSDISFCEASTNGSNKKSCNYISSMSPKIQITIIWVWHMIKTRIYQELPHWIRFIVAAGRLLTCVKTAVNEAVGHGRRHFELGRPLAAHVHYK